MNPFPNASQSFLDLNPQLSGSGVSGERSANEASAGNAVRPDLEQRAPARTPRAKQPKAEDSKRFFVRVTSVRRRLIDEDNLCEKYVVDCCRYAGLIDGDEPGKTRIEATQRKAGKEEREHTLIEIFTAEPTTQNPNEISK
jgi:hypothetical protein